MPTPDQPIGEHFSQTDIRKQRFLIISALFPPDIMGGAELCAYNLAHWLRGRGAEVGVLTTAKTPDEAQDEQDIDGVKVWRVWMPRAYSAFNAARAKGWQKPLWHLQDHFDPRNRKIVARILKKFKPDHIHIHVLQGIGYNALIDIAESKIPTVFFLHDLGLACFRMGMFKNGRECTKQCSLCRISSSFKARCIKQAPDMSFISPSLANLNTLAKYFPVTDKPHAVIMNASRYPLPTAPRTESDRVRLLFIGRLHATKGIDVLLTAATNLALKHAFSLTVVGSGPDEAHLREAYGALPWCTFTGFITQQEISNRIVNSDVLCIPSIWAENSPGVVIQALGLGLPVIGSDKGGIPELVEDGKNGRLVPAGDAAAWEAALGEVLKNPALLAPWRHYALEHTYKFDQDYLGQKLLDFMHSQLSQEQKIVHK